MQTTRWLFWALTILGHHGTVVSSRACELPDAKNVSAFVVAGSDAPVGLYTYMVSLRGRGGLHFCGGVLIHPRWVLTSATCAQKAPPGKFNLFIGGHCRDGDKLTEVHTTSVRPMINNLFTGSQPLAGKDLALLKLDKKSKKKPAKLPNQLALSGRRRKAGYISMGWGRKSGRGGFARVLNHLQEMMIFSEEDCKDAVPRVDTTSILCAGNTGATCAGDEGGPLVSASKFGKDVVVGIATAGGAFRLRCGESASPNVYTSIQPNVAWIKKTIRKRP